MYRIKTNYMVSKNQCQSVSSVKSVFLFSFFLKNQRSFSGVDYQPKNCIPRPDASITMPATRCMYFSLDLNFKNEEPRCPRWTINIMVAMVAMPKKMATEAMPKVLLCTAGINNIGIKTSQGPKTKMINKTQGVNLVSSTFFSNP